MLCSDPCRLIAKEKNKAAALATYQSGKYREKYRESQKRYRRTPEGRLSHQLYKHQRRARIYGAFVEHVLFEVVIERANSTCHLCSNLVFRDRQVPDHWAPTFDHVIPLSQGGTHDYGNVRLAHFICNTRRGTRTIGSFRAHWLASIHQLWDEEFPKVF